MQSVQVVSQCDGKCGAQRTDPWDGAGTVPGGNWLFISVRHRKLGELHRLAYCPTCWGRGHVTLDFAGVSEITKESTPND